MVKNILGISKYARTKPLFNAIKIEQITQLYLKHKIFFLKQIYLNHLTKEIYEFLVRYYNFTLPPKGSFIYQIKQVEELVGYKPSILNVKEVIVSIENQFICNDIDLNENLNTILKNYDPKFFYESCRLLNNLLCINNNNIV